MDEYNVRRAALVVASLDRVAADRMLETMPPAAAQAMRDMMVQIADIDTIEQQQVMRDFLQSDEVIHRHSEGKLPSPAVRVPRQVGGDAASIGAEERLEAMTEDALNRASERVIAECLSDELPQAIAVACAHLPAHRASEIVAHLPTPQQAQVLERLVELDSTSSLEFPEIREEFQEWFKQQIERSLHRADLAERLATILEATHSGTRERILHNISESDARLAKELQEQLAAIADGQSSQFMCRA